MNKDACMMEPLQEVISLYQQIEQLKYENEIVTAKRSKLKIVS